MKHTDGITTFLGTLHESPVKEYDNEDGTEVHPEFDGSIGTRQVALRRGTEFEVAITFEEDFKLYSADGVSVGIYNASQLDSLDPNDRGQWWFIAPKSGSILGTYKFTFYTLFEDDDTFPGNQKQTNNISFSIPKPSGGKYENASFNWLEEEDRPLNRSSLVIYIRRTKWVVEPPRQRTRMEPKQWPKSVEPGVPVIIHSEWTRPLISDNGRPYIFEYRNIGSKGIEASRVEAEQEFGNEYDFIVHSDEDADSDSDDEQDENEDESDTDYQGVPDDGNLSPNQVYDTESEHATGEETESDEEPFRPTRLSRKRKRSASPKIYGSKQKSSLQGRTKVVKLNACYRKRCSSCNPDEEDNPEPLPQPGIIPAKIETKTPPPPARLQQFTPVSSREETFAEPSDNANPNMHRERSATLPERPKRKTASNGNSRVNNLRTPSISSPASIQRVRNPRKQVESIDLTADSDEEVQVKQETTTALLTPRNSKVATTAAHGDRADEEDLRDEMRLIEIRMRLRAMERERQASGRT